MNNSFTVNGFEIGAGRRPYIVAEMSGNHNGSLDRALALVDAAAAALPHSSLAQTGAAKADLVGHSEGGFQTLYVTKTQGISDRIDKVVAIVPPTHGTTVAGITGLARDVVYASMVPAAALEVFVLANQIPNLLRRLFAEGAFSQAFVPILAETKAKDPARTKAIVDAVGDAAKPGHVGSDHRKRR